MIDVAPEERTVELGTGLRYHVVTWGAADAPPVVLVHGFLDHAWSWASVATRLAAAGRRVIAPDLRGHGDSDRVGAGGYYHFFDYVADLDALVDALGLGQLDLVGHSMGGTVSAYLAGTRPARIRRLALLEGLGPPDGSGQLDGLPARTAGWIDGWRRARAGGLGPALADLDDAVARLRRHDPRLAPDLARWLAEHGTRRDPDGALRWKHDPLHLTQGPYPFRRDHAEAYWRAITAPVLLVDGAASTIRLAPAEAAARAAALRDARAVTLPDAGHMMMRHQPAALADALLAFLG
ncbi:MAG: alpha/beta hydrolase [Kofleriaceae bacterium]